MRSSRVVALCVALLSLVLTHFSYGAAQLAAGALTSARPTSTNPQIRACQITFDPLMSAGASPGATTVPLSTLALTNFKLSVQYDPSLLTVNDVKFLLPYVEHNPLTTIGATPGAAVGGTSQFFTTTVVNSNVAILGNISGFTFPTSVPAGQDVDIFLVDFTLNEGVSMNTPLPITIFANPQTGDFTQGTDPNTGQVVTTPPTGVVVPTFINFTFNEDSALAAGVPLPRSAAAGMVTLALLAGFGVVRRRRALVA